MDLIQPDLLMRERERKRERERERRERDTERERERGREREKESEQGGARSNTFRSPHLRVGEDSTFEGGRVDLIEPEMLPEQCKGLRGLGAKMLHGVILHLLRGL